MKWRYIIWMLIGFAGFKSQAQQFRFVNINKELKIPSPVCYNIYRDYQGYIWIGTDAGLCRYNGSSLQIFDEKNGLPEASIYEMAEDPNHMMWFATASNRLLNFANDSLQEPPIGKKYTEFVNSIYAIPFKIQFASKSEAYVNARTGTYKINILENSITKIISEEDNVIPFVKIKNKLILIRYFGFFNKPNISVKLTHGNITETIVVPRDKVYGNHWRIESLANGNTCYIALDNNLVKVNNDYSHEIYHLPTRILDLFVDEKGGLWVGTYQSGVYHFPNADLTKKPIRNLTDISISAITEDYEGSIWCSSLEKGIFYCRNKEIIDYSNISGLNKFTDLLKVENGKIYSSSDGFKIIEIGDEVITYPLNPNNGLNIYDIKKVDDGWIIGSAATISKADNNFKNIQLLKNPILKSGSIGYQFETGADNVLYSVAYDVVIEIKNNQVFMHNLPIKILSKRLLYKGNNQFYIGSDQGLHELELKTLQLKKILGKSPVTQIIKGSRGTWVATKGDGLYLITNSRHIKVNEALQIPTNFFYNITEDSSHNIWAGTNIGLIKIYREDNQYQYEIFDMLDGLPANNIYKVETYKGDIYIGTIEGINKISPRIKNNHVAPNIFLNSIYINETKWKGPTCSTSDFTYNQNSFRFGFDVISYPNFSHKNLFYSLKTEKSIRTQSLAGNEIILDNLAPNEYELNVYGVNNDGILSNTPFKYTFIIHKPFWKSIWFISLSIAVLLIISFVTVKKIIDNIRKKEQAKTQINKMMAEYQLSAIQAQMNPHFIFNAINSIQSYILQKDETQAYDYLAKFSKLIRMVLNNSEQKVLSLSQELETLNLYIQLEQLRFENKFDYELHIAEDVNVYEVFVPGMLIQPYVENAIWHGLMNLNGIRKGVLSINISCLNDELLIFVEDNGMGREFTQKEKQISHKSMGMELGKKRLKMINELQDFENARVSIIDVYDDNGQASGTRIEIYIPLK